MSLLKYYELKTKIRSLKKSDVSPIYLFFGVEDYLKEDTVAHLEKILIEPDMHDLNYSMFHIPDKNEKQLEKSPSKSAVLGDALMVANSLPFISDKRMVIIKNIHKLPESQDVLLEKYIEKPCQTTCLVFVGGDKLPKREIFRRVEKLYPTINFYNLFDNQICSWIIEYTKTLNKNISSAVADEMLKVTGNALYNIKNEIDKLVLYTDGKNEIEIGDVGRCCGCFKENTVFELMPALASKKIDTAVKVLSKLLNGGEDEYMILATISDRYRKYLRFNELMQTGVDRLEAATRCGVRFFREAFLDDAAQLEKEEIVNFLGKILETEIQMKSGGNSKLHIERLVFEMCLKGGV